MHRYIMAKGDTGTSGNCDCDKCNHRKPKPPLIVLKNEGLLPSGIDFNKNRKFKHDGQLIVIQPFWYIWFWHKGQKHTTLKESVIKDLQKKDLFEHGILEKRVVYIYKRKWIPFTKAKLDKTLICAVENMDDIVAGVKDKLTKLKSAKDYLKYFNI